MSQINFHLIKKTRCFAHWSNKIEAQVISQPGKSSNDIRDHSNYTWHLWHFSSTLNELFRPLPPLVCYFNFFHWFSSPMPWNVKWIRMKVSFRSLKFLSHKSFYPKPHKALLQNVNKACMTLFWKSRTIWIAP